MYLATTTGDFFSYTRSQREALRHIRAAGFRFADYSFGCDHRERTGVYSETWQAHIEDMIRAQEEHGIRLIQAHSPMGKPLVDPDKALLTDTIRCVDACGAWGIPNLVVHSGYRPGISPEETFAENRAFFLPILERAEKYGVNILVENFNRMHVEGMYWIDNAPDLLAQIECVNHPLFHAVWDTGHANMQEMPQDEALRILGSHVRAVHVQDNMGDTDAHLQPFLGTMNMDAVMHGLADIGYTGYFTFEVGGVFAPAAKRRPYEADRRLSAAPLALKDAAERYLYELGRIVLESYGVYEG